MPGAYAHMTLANRMRETSLLESIPDFPGAAISAVLTYFEFVELGAVSPDYPYLCIADSHAAQWADAMHYDDTGGMIRAGVDLLKNLSGEARQKGLAWLLGYTSHVVADMTIHPVVQLKVGPYDDNKTGHRICEMNQDVHIFKQLNIGEVGLSNHLKNGIGRCGSPDGLDLEIEALWRAMLKAVYPDKFSSNPPEIHKWHKGFVGVVNLISQGQKLMPMARHVAVGIGLTYPSPATDFSQFVKDLQVPTGHLDYDAVFEQAIANVCSEWCRVAAGLFDNDSQYLTHYGKWNLDTGKDTLTDTLVYWG